MKVLLGATAVWLTISIVLGGSIFLMTKGTLWPFFVVLLGLVVWIKQVACTSH